MQVEGIAIGEPLPSEESYIGFRWGSMDALGEVSLEPSVLVEKLQGWLAQSHPDALLTNPGPWPAV